jgi:hypothetical protein
MQLIPQIMVMPLMSILVIINTPDFDVYVSPLDDVLITDSP